MANTLSAGTTDRELNQRIITDGEISTAERRPTTLSSPCSNRHNQAVKT